MALRLKANKAKTERIDGRCEKEKAEAQRLALGELLGEERHSSTV